MSNLQFFILLICSTLIASELTDEEILTEFSRKFRVPRTAAASSNVVKNYRAIVGHNLRFKEGRETFNQSLNQFSSLSLEEISKTKLGALENDPNEPRNVVNITFITGNSKGRAITPPENFRWPDSIVGKVKYQADCGSCYAFAAINVIKSKLALTYGITNFDLSEQDGMECTRGCKLISLFLFVC